MDTMPSDRKLVLPTTELELNFDSGQTVGSNNIVLCKPATGFVRRSHEHEHAYLSLTLSGGWRETYSARGRECGPGGFAVHLPEARHARLHTEPNTRELYLEIEPSELPEGWKRGIERARWAAARPLMHALFASLQQNDPVPLHQEALAAELLGEMFGSGHRHEQSPSAWILDVRASLEADVVDIPSLRVLASRVGTHPSNLARSFRATYGLSIGQYALRIRIGQALDMMQQKSHSLASIAARTGFADQSHFGRIFRRMIGVSPGHYRMLLLG